MRIYAVADIHGSRERLSEIRSNVINYRPHLLVLAGDITQYAGAGPFIRALDRLSVPALCIRGNSDLAHVEGLVNTSKNLTLLGASPITLCGYRFLGLNGTLPLPFASKIRFTEQLELDKLAPHMTRDTVLVAHPPPRNVLDKTGGLFHAGSRNLNRFIRTHRPKIMLCGHIHEQAGYVKFRDTLVVNCAMGSRGNGAFLEFLGNDAVRVKILPPVLK